MNTKWYSFGNPWKVKNREHFCYKCGTKLSVVEHCKIVSTKSDEAKYYDFSIGSDGVMIGSCEFIHKVFYCSKCSENIEFVTQINQEDIDILINKTKGYFNKKGRSIIIKKRFENHENMIEDNVSNIEHIINLCLIVEENEKQPLIIKIPIRRKKYWERPYYFRVTKKQLIGFIKR